MKPLLNKLAAAVVRLAGGRPEVVLPLYEAIEKAAAGSHDILRKQSRRKAVISAQFLRVLGIGVTFIFSLVLSVTMLIDPGNIHPPPGVLILVGVHWLLVLNMVLGLAGPSLLVDDDHKVLGWWPVTRREIMLARLGTLLKPALQTTLALMAAPLVVYAIVGRPILLTAAVFGLGLILQAICVTFGAAVALSLLVRMLGRTKAQRLAALLADGNNFFYFWLIFLVAPRIWPWLKGHTEVLNALPPLWFGAFGDLAAGPHAWLMASVGVIVTAILVGTGLRLMVAADAGSQAVKVEKAPSPRHPSRLVSWLLQPWMKGREGWVLRRLLESHLREDWRFIGGMISMPLVMLVFFFGAGGNMGRDLVDADINRTALGAVSYTHMLILMAASVLHLSAFSSTPAALWLVALADLDTRRLLSGQRGMVRGLITAPMLLVYGIRAMTLGAPPWIALLDMAVLGLQVEIIVTVMQPILMVMPFSRGYTNDQSARRMLIVFISMGVAVVFIAMNFVYAEVATARYVVWVLLPLLLWAARWWLGRRVGDRRLHMERVTG